MEITRFEIDDSKRVHISHATANYEYFKIKTEATQSLFKVQNKKRNWEFKNWDPRTSLSLLLHSFVKEDSIENGQEFAQIIESDTSLYNRACSSHLPLETFDWELLLPFVMFLLVHCLVMRSCARDCRRLFSNPTNPSIWWNQRVFNCQYVPLQ